MALVVPNCGEVVSLSRIVNKTATGDVRLKLFSNNVTPGEATVLGDLTEVSGSGYTDKSLTGANWTVATDGSNNTTASYAKQSFALTGAATVYGYYVTTADGNTLIWLERFTDGPYSVPSGGGTIEVTPVIGGN